MNMESWNELTGYVRDNRADGFVLVISFVLFHVMLVVGAVQIINRYVGLPFGVYWAGEAARTAMVLLTLTLLPYLFYKELDISFLPILKKLSEARLNLVLLVRNLLLVGFSASMVWSAYLAYFQSAQTTLPTIGWFRLRWMYLFMGASFLVLLGYVLVDTKWKVQETLASGER